MKKKTKEPNFCFICGVEILHKLGFNTGPMQPKNIQILSNLRNSWIKSLRILLNINDENCETVLKMVPFCFSCHELILGVDFMMSTISRFESRLVKIQKQIKGLLRHNSKNRESPHRDLIQEILSPSEQIEIKIEEDEEEVINDIISASALQIPRNVEGQVSRIPVDVNVEGIDTDPECSTDIEMIEEQEDDGDGQDNGTEWTRPEANVEPARPEVNGQLIRPQASATPKLKGVEEGHGDIDTIEQRSVQGRDVTIAKWTRLEPKATDTKPEDAKSPRIRKFWIYRLKNPEQSSTFNRVETRRKLLNFPCQFCGKRFESDSDLKQHEVLHIPASAESNPFFCVFCPFQVTNTFELQKHVLSEHERLTQPMPSRKFQCEQCPSRFTKNWQLMTHNRRTHPPSDKWYSCTQCPYKAKLSSKTKIHMLTHGDKCFKCEIGQCTKKFNTKNNLSRHQRRVHGAKPFGCTLCTKSFSSSSRLKQHQEYHSTLRPYMCEICSATFKSTKNLQQHYKVHDGNKVTGNNLKLRNPRKPRISDIRIQNATGTPGSGFISNHDELQQE